MYRVKVRQWDEPVYVRGGRSSDTKVLYEMLVTQDYEIVDTADAKSIVDGGANIGLASRFFLRRYPAAHAVAVEPFPETMEVCKRNLEAFSDRASAIQGAVWPQEGTVDLDPQGQEWANQVKASSHAKGNSVPAYSMSSLISLSGGSVDILKLDVEGSEKEIFKTGTMEWLPFVRNIVIELHDEECRERFFTALSSFDYEVSNRGRVYFCRNLRLRQSVGAAS